MHSAEIICSISKAGYTQTKIADLLGMNSSSGRSTVSQVIHGKSNSNNVATLISKITSIPLNKLWPDGRYDSPSRRGRPPKSKLPKKAA